MVKPGQHWSCCVNNWELPRSLLIAAAVAVVVVVVVVVVLVFAAVVAAAYLLSLSSAAVASALLFRVCNAKSKDNVDSSSELCEDEDEVAFIFTSGFTCMLADWFSTRGDKLSRCCRKCSSVSFRRVLNISDVFLVPTAPIEFDRHSATTGKGYLLLYYVFCSFEKL